VNGFQFLRRIVSYQGSKASTGASPGTKEDQTRRPVMQASGLSDPRKCQATLTEEVRLGLRGLCEARGATYRTANEARVPQIRAKKPSSSSCLFLAMRCEVLLVIAACSKLEFEEKHKSCPDLGTCPQSTRSGAYGKRCTFAGSEPGFCCLATLRSCKLIK
jgi:hypothetical protein